MQTPCHIGPDTSVDQSHTRVQSPIGDRLPTSPKIRQRAGADADRTLGRAGRRDIVRFHDPHGYPYATMPTDEFAVAWRADSIPYADVEYRMWSGFHRARVIAPLQALRTSLIRPWLG
jgi:hypothetical protein